MQGGRRTTLQETLSGPPPLPSVPEPLRAESSPAVSSTSGTDLPVRKLLAVLAAPKLGHGGSIFPVRAGKNAIGADRANDILLAGDSEVSGEHAVILHRNGAFHLTDRLSTNGTWVNGQEVTANGTVELHDRDRVRCGRTELVFLMIEPAESSAVGTDDDSSSNA
ncbi:MAG: FHA domain-containing protein [Thermoanaerobaculia bacterium]